MLTTLNDYLSCRHQKKVRTPYVPITNTMNINTTRFVNNFITKKSWSASITISTKFEFNRFKKQRIKTTYVNRAVTSIPISNQTHTNHVGTKLKEIRNFPPFDKFAITYL